MVPNVFARVHDYGKELAIGAMNDYIQPHQQLNENSFPATCPWSFGQIMQEDWLPEG